MTPRDRRIGIRNGYQPWSDRIAWLIGREFGYSLELVMDNFNTPLLIEPDSAISKDRENLSKYFKNVAQDWVQRDEMRIEALFDRDTKTVHVRIENGQPGLTLFIHIPEQLRIREIIDEAGARIPYTLWSDLGGAAFSVKANTEEFIIRLELNPM
ncbi:MAG: hypothetical protein FGF48_10505 [Candidatus Brockarchaeota archaeon]|nr:hypothetical protein [Candidatus Brockarchaeota archaeon]